jgi:hypothetical protein
MNERIRELAEQAQEYAGQQIDEGADWDDAPIYYTEKLTELIIMDVASKLEPVLASEILELYGVEE